MARFSMLYLLQLLLVGSASAFMPQSARPAFVRPISSRDVAVDTASIKNGMTIEIDKEPYKVLSFSIMKQARGDAKTTIKFNILMRGTTIGITYSTDRVRNSKRP
jgi:elongation factor P